MNNPVNMIDEDGNWGKWAKAITAVAVAAVVVTAVVVFAPVAAIPAVLTLTAIGTGVGAGTNVAKQVLVDKKPFSDIDWAEVTISAAAGGASGALGGSGIGRVGQAIGNAFISGGARMANGGNALEVLEAAGTGGLAGWLSGPGAWKSWSDLGVRGMCFSDKALTARLFDIGLKSMFKSYVVSGGYDILKKVYTDHMSPIVNQMYYGVRRYATTLNN